MAKVVQFVKKNLARWYFFLMIEVVVLVCFGIVIGIQQSRQESAVDVSLSDWRSTRYITFDDGWYVDETMLEANVDEDKVICLYGPYIYLKKGTYSVVVEYECDSDQSCQVYANNENDTYIKGGTGKLNKSLKKMSYAFTLTEDIDNFEFVVDYNRQGSLWIKNIEIKPNISGILRNITMVLLFFLLFDLAFYFRKDIVKNRNLIFELGWSIILISLPLFASGINNGSDLMFHLTRIERLAEEMRRGNIPARISALWMEGYPISVFYGNALLYIPAFFRIMGFPVIIAYKFYILFINTATILCSYLCFRNIFKNKDIAVVTSLAYVTAGYRIMCIYGSCAVGEYSAMLFYPLIVLALYQFYTLDPTAERSYRRYSSIFALGMAGVIGTHILSAGMIIVTIALLCIILWRKTFTRSVLQAYLVTIIETIILSAYFWIPFLDYFSAMSVNINNNYDKTEIIQDYGFFIGGYFGVAQISGLVIAVAMWVNKKASREIKFFTITSIIMLFIASDLFPWNYLETHYKLGRILSDVQFPKKYIAIAILFLTILLGNVCKALMSEARYYKKFNIFIVGICFFMAVFFASSYSNSSKVRMEYFYDTAELNMYDVGLGEVKQDTTDVDLFSGHIFQENMQEVSVLSKDGTCMELYCVGGETEGAVEVPFLNIRGYCVTDEYGKNYRITDGENNVIRFILPAGYSGKITIDFVEPWYWEIGILISLIFVIKVIYVCVRKRSNVPFINVNKKFVLLTQLACIMLMIVVMGIQYINRPKLKVPLTEWKSKYANFNGGWYIDEEAVQVDGTIDMLYGPYIDLQKGSYSIRIDYECDEDQGCLAYANSGNEAYIKTALEVLPKDRKSISYDFTLTKDIDNFEVVVKYNGSGDFCIRNIEISTNTVGMQRKLLISCLLFLIMDIFIFFYKTNKQAVIFNIGLVLILWMIGEELAGAQETSWVEMEEIHKYPDSYDVCILGSSTARFNNSNQELYEQYGIASISLTDLSQPIYVAKYTLEEALKYQSPQVVFFDTGALFYSNEMDMKWTTENENYLLYDFLGGIRTLSTRLSAFKAIQKYDSNVNLESYIIKFENVHNNWKNYLKPDMEKGDENERIHGNIPLMAIGDTLGNIYDTSNPDTSMTIDEDVEKYLSEMIELCNDADVDFVLLTERVVFGKAEHKAVDMLAEKYGVKHIDINEHIEEIGFEYDTDCRDPHHFNLSGAIKCSSFLGDYLLDNYEIADKRNDPDYERYEEYRDAFSEKRKAAVSGVSFHRYLMELADLNKEDYSIFISVYDDATDNLSDEGIELFRKLGLETDLSEKFRCSYAAVICGSTIQEKFSMNAPVRIKGDIDNLSYEVTSGGLTGGDDASIVIDGIDCIHKGRGFNFVVYNRRDGKIESSVYFDTYEYSNPFAMGILEQ